MTRRAVPASRLAPCVTALLLAAASASAADVNEAFVRRSLESFFAEALSALPIGEKEIALGYTEPVWDNLNVTGAALHSAVRSYGSQLSTCPDSTGSIRLQFRLSEAEFSYENRNGNLFSRGDLYRVLQVAGSFTLSRNLATVWEDYLIREYREKIELDDRGLLENSSSPLFSAELPPGPVQRIWEPVIVTSIVGGLVYLFFASR